VAVLAAEFAVVRPAAGVAGVAGVPGVRGAAAAGTCGAGLQRLAVPVMYFPPGPQSVNAALYRKEPVRCRIHPILPPHPSDGKRVL
jgi:hypothetical protein